MEKATVFNKQEPLRSETILGFQAQNQTAPLMPEQMYRRYAPQTNFLNRFAKYTTITGGFVSR